MPQKKGQVYKEQMPLQKYSMSCIIFSHTILHWLFTCYSQSLLDSIKNISKRKDFYICVYIWAHLCFAQIQMRVLILCWVNPQLLTKTKTKTNKQINKNQQQPNKQKPTNKICWEQHPQCWSSSLFGFCFPSSQISCGFKSKEIF